LDSTIQLEQCGCASAESKKKFLFSHGDVTEIPAKTSTYDSRNAYRGTDTTLLALFSKLEILVL